MKIYEAFQQTLGAQNIHTLFIMLFQFSNYHIALKPNFNYIDTQNMQVPKP